MQALASPIVTHGSSDSASAPFKWSQPGQQRGCVCRAVTLESPGQMQQSQSKTWRHGGQIDLKITGKSWGERGEGISPRPLDLMGALETVMTLVEIDGASSVTSAAKLLASVRLDERCTSTALKTTPPRPGRPPCLPPHALKSSPGPRHLPVALCESAGTSSRLGFE